MKMRKIQFYLTDGQLDRLKILTDRTGLKHAEIVRRLIDGYLSEIENQLLKGGDKPKDETE